MINLDDVSITHIVSTILGGGGASIICRWVLERGFKTLAEITSRLEVLTHKLSMVEARLEDLKELRQLTTDHDRKIVNIESRLHRHATKLAHNDN